MISRCKINNLRDKGLSLGRIYACIYYLYRYNRGFISWKEARDKMAKLTGNVRYDGGVFVVNGIQL